MKNVLILCLILIGFSQCKNSEELSTKDWIRLEVENYLHYAEDEIAKFISKDSIDYRYNYIEDMDIKGQNCQQYQVLIQAKSAEGEEGRLLAETYLAFDTTNRKSFAVDIRSGDVEEIK